MIQQTCVFFTLRPEWGGLLGKPGARCKCDRVEITVRTEFHAQAKPVRFPEEKVEWAIPEAERHTDFIEIIYFCKTPVTALEFDRVTQVGIGRE
ncbi:MAG: hypothetical protein KJN79_01335 [Gammaproteobacteria bacterium]|nr:hypothetical protein [Gammaproteobacteria bacterium]NNL96477.1 hypothetical protein [Xanthomonadales bacterium]